MILTFFELTSLRLNIDWIGYIFHWTWNLISVLSGSYICYRFRIFFTFWMKFIWDTLYYLIFYFSVKPSKRLGNGESIFDLQTTYRNTNNFSTYVKKKKLKKKLMAKSFRFCVANDIVWYLLAIIILQH